ncbi:hypothetical protein RHMOL_Rhmol05G0073700 [Rhododendron molle]|uniref:Uncharacterized protein n=1 Tax=Rhododendron molle TaxID=49168 RepID=A0ACC0NLJ6_RHOML|nr:hypothetical protein RHMOL_Rhmol05G0073700 [Rhododendron molle]
MNEEERSWNEEKIDDLLPAEIGSIIKATPISWTGCDGALVWGQSSSGNYTVKSGYHLAFEGAFASDDLQGSSSTELSNTIWKAIWRLKSPPRIKHFLWRAITNAIATKEICLPGSVLGVLRVVFVELRLNPLRVCCLDICWAIWKQRNEWIFSQQKPNAERAIKHAFQVYGDFLAAACSQENRLARNHGDSNASKWQRPPHDRWKFNCDGAFNPSDKSAAFAVLVRDNNGSVVEVNHGRIKVSSALAAAAWAIRIAVSMAKAWGKRVAIIIESDCKVLVGMLGPETTHKDWTIQALLDDIMGMSLDSNFVFKWCKRQANRCANWIACTSKRSFIPPLSPCNLPVELCSLIRMDL